MSNNIICWVWKYMIIAIFWNQCYKMNWNTQIQKISENIVRNLLMPRKFIIQHLIFEVASKLHVNLENTCTHTHTHTHILYTRIQLYTSFKVNSQTIVTPWHGIMWSGACNYHPSYWSQCKFIFPNLSDYKTIHMKLI